MSVGFDGFHAGYDGGMRDFVHRVGVGAYFGYRDNSGGHIFSVNLKYRRSKCFVLVWDDEFEVPITYLSWKAGTWSTATAL